MESNAYYEDIRYRKNLAAQARFRKGKIGGRKCTLSSDRMTAKQWKERCGELKTYQMGSPMAWQEFCEMPCEKKTEYIRGLQEKYGANAAAMSRMFGITPGYFSKYIKSNDIGVEFSTRRMTPEEQTAFSQFCGVWESPPEAVAEETEDAPEASQAPPERPCRMDGLSIAFSGKIDLGEVYNSLRTILGASPEGMLKVVWQRSGEECGRI